ncbi:MAG: FecR family protein [Chryseobacterium sp.]|nr:MAG: FecR family protein [Chryseobacterium sp.]
MKDQAQLIALFNKYLSNKCSLEEVEELMLYFNSTQSNVLEERILSEFESLALQDESSTALPPRVFEKIKARISTAKSNPVRRKLWPRIAVAAAVAVVVFGAGMFYLNERPKDDSKTTAFAKDIDPAGNKAFLTLGNGKRIALTDAGNGTVAIQTGVQISKTADGQLIYTVSENNSSTPSTLEYNTIETPNGGRYQVALPDGTKVWMNAASSLKYPASFASLKERKVELQGEAYFQVAKDKQHPFIVKTDQQEVKVLGTHFNINSYTDEPEAKTTLLEGSVNVSELGSEKSKMLVPGQQAIIKGANIIISQADLDQAVSWKNGEFVFTGEDLKTVMRQVARWYDVDVEYKANVNMNGIFSAFPRTMKLSQLLKALEANQGIHFKMEGRRVLVMP